MVSHLLHAPCCPCCEFERVSADNFALPVNISWKLKGKSNENKESTKRKESVEIRVTHAQRKSFSIFYERSAREIEKRKSGRNASQSRTHIVCVFRVTQKHFLTATGQRRRAPSTSNDVLKRAFISISCCCCCVHSLDVRRASIEHEHEPFPL